MAKQTEPVLTRVEATKYFLREVATGGRGDDRRYKAYRRALEKSLGSDNLPEIVRDCPGIGDFWERITSMFSTYAERREYLDREFTPLISRLRRESPDH